ncbi:NAD(P)-dependent oxidoreductase [Candidatus Woesearchaeota archaeon]|nr:NAD(P)-dependent oxidoreductase [Candidatus Woesearchaeota archaeon]
MIDSALAGKSILVTGGSGFIGTHLIRRLQSLGADILNISIEAPQVPVSTIEDDLRTTDFSWLDEGFDYVVHLAALSHKAFCPDLQDAFDTNVGGTLRLLDALSTRTRITKIVHTSSIVLYSDKAQSPIDEDAPIDVMGDHYTFTKGLAEQVVRYFQKTLPITILRLSNAYGPYQHPSRYPHLLAQTIHSALTQGTITIQNPTPIRDFIFVDDIIDAIVAALLSDKKGICNIGTGVGTSIGEIGDQIAMLTGATIQKLDKPTWGPTKIICDVSAAKKDLQWIAKTPLIDGLKQTIAWNKEHA